MRILNQNYFIYFFQEMDISQIDPYKILGVSKNFTLDQLKEAYKKIALQVHPDRGGTEYMFKLVTTCYKELAKEYNRRTSDRQYHELKADFAKNQALLPQQKQSTSHRQIDATEAKSSFNINKFNKVFETNKLQTVHDTGYEQFLKNSKEVEQKNIFAGKKFSNETFNKQFEKRVQAASEPNKFIVKYKEPEALLTCKKIGFVELGEESVDDFSATNTSHKNLNYMDLKIAHTTSRIIDPKTIEKRKEYRSIDELKVDRGNISYNMDDIDKDYYEKKKKEEEIKERLRLQSVMKQDQEAAIQYDKVHRLLLGR